MNEQPFDLVACDVDGTLFDQSEAYRGIHDELRRFIHEKNIPFTLISGRSWPGIANLVNYFGLQLPVVTNNGAVAYSRDRAIWSHAFSASLVRQAIEEADRQHMAIVYTTGREEYSYRINEYLRHQITTFHRYERERPISEQAWCAAEFVKVMITDPRHPGAIDEVLSQLPQEANDTLNVVRYSDRSADLMSRWADKAHGLQQLTEYLGAHRVLMLGDDVNDIRAFAQADVGVAVANARPELQQAADWVTTQEHAGGVLEALQRYFA